MKTFLVISLLLPAVFLTLQEPKTADVVIQIINDDGMRIDNKESISPSASNVFIIRVIPKDSTRYGIDRYMVAGGRIFIPDQEPKVFNGPRISIGGVRSGTISISVDSILKRNEDGTSERMVPKEKYISINIR